MEVGTDFVFPATARSTIVSPRSEGGNPPFARLDDCLGSRLFGTFLTRGTRRGGLFERNTSVSLCPRRRAGHSRLIVAPASADRFSRHFVNKSSRDHRVHNTFSMLPISSDPNHRANQAKLTRAGHRDKPISPFSSRSRARCERRKFHGNSRIVRGNFDGPSRSFSFFRGHSRLRSRNAGLKG